MYRIIEWLVDKLERRESIVVVANREQEKIRKTKEKEYKKNKKRYKKRQKNKTTL